ncbi:MAG TPA: ferric reductase-like transmembrane domain-containing protein, partial [Paracoccaceae bacterium]|nr:ferric reductase-like transmembrane domain-containing protein [Paracoccaceae bacterium]
MKPVLLILAYLLVVLLPMTLSWAMGYPPRPFRHELASGAGMLAFAMVLAEFVLSGRFRSVSRGVGLDVTIRFHQMMARTALVLALVHPFLYRNITGPQRPWDVTRQLTITSDFAALATGVAAFVLLPTLVLTAIGRSQLDYRYETWRLMHGLGALLIAGLLLHHAVYAGRYSGDPVMTGLWLAMTGVAVLSLAIVYVFKPLAQLRRPWRVTRVE